MSPSARISSSFLITLLIGVLLAVVTIAVYGPVLDCDFINIDDPAYVAENDHVLAGPTASGLLWASTTTEGAHWHPLTWLSLMLDARIGGPGPRVFHLTNLLLHVANSLLLFVVFRRMTRDVWRSAFVAALFAIHPLHVESVAWVVERKDVLSTFFGILTILAYCLYVERPGAARYLGMSLLFSLTLLSKPMLVTLPLLLLLLDYWPLGRFTRPGALDLQRRLASRSTRASRMAVEDENRDDHRSEKPFKDDRVSKSSRRMATISPLVLEKAPLFILSLASSAITLVAQKQAGAIRSLEQFPLAARAANALVAFVTYIWKMLWPSGLAVYYPYPRFALTDGRVVACGLLLAGLTALAIWIGRTHRYVLVGWLWYVITLVPVIGLVQSGRQAMADRFTYIPLIGLFVIVTWGAAELLLGGRPRASHHLRPHEGRLRPAEQVAGRSRTVESGGLRHALLAAVGGVVIVSLAACARVQVGYWRDSVILLEHALQVTSDNAFAHNNLGIALARKRSMDQAFAHWKEAVRIAPDYPDALANLCGALIARGDLEAGASRCMEALRIWSDHPGAHSHLGLALMRQGKLEEAAAHLEKSVALRPRDASTLNNLGIVLVRLGQPEASVPHFREAVRIEPNLLDAHLNLGVILVKLGRLQEAESQFREALRIDPGNERAVEGLKRSKGSAREKVEKRP